MLYSFKSNGDPAKITDTVQAALLEYFPRLIKQQKVTLSVAGDFIVIFSAETVALTFTLRFYLTNQLFTLNCEVANGCDEFAHFTNRNLETLKGKLEQDLQLDSIERLLVLKRDSVVPLYFEKSNGCVLEYDFDRVVAHKKSAFQDIKILHSPTLDNVLLLDDLQNLGEGDINYTRGLMKFGINSYTGTLPFYIRHFPLNISFVIADKEVLILGGGDGGLLHELLKESPKSVTMVDIDGDVMDLCKVHLRGACGSDLDSFKGSNYEVIVGDCLVYMKQYIADGKTFDYVFNDLTDIPISSKDTKEPIVENSPQLWDFVKQILELGLQLVRPTGKYLNHVRAGSYRPHLYALPH